MDLATISEKEVFVRKANLVSSKRIINIGFRMILKGALQIASRQFISAV